MGKITVNTNSWHYKLVDTMLTNSSPKENLCGYFWQIVGSILIVLASIFSFLFILHLPGLVLMSVGAVAVSYWLILVIGIVFWAVFIGGMVLYNLYKNHRDITYNDGKENIVVSWFKAKKSKICPIIEFKDKE